jgi:GT2 family glycosyltransferase
VYAQRGVHWEVIVVDDASHDDTWAWLTALDDARVTVLRQETAQRQGVARNRGLAVARGRFVCFLDDDDLLWPDALRALSALLQATPGAVAAIGAREDWFTWQGYRRRDVHPRRMRVRDISADLFTGWSAIPSQTLFRTASVRDAGGFAPELVPCEDRDLLHRVAAHGPVVFCPETVVTYRITPTQWRPVGIRTLRERVARRAIHRLPKAQWRAALQRRHFVRLIDLTEDECTSGSLLRALRLVLDALRTAPGVLASPMLALWIARRLAGRVARRIIPAPSVSSESAAG